LGKVSAAPKESKDEFEKKKIFLPGRQDEAEKKFQGGV